MSARFESRQKPADTWLAVESASQPGRQTGETRCCAQHEQKTRHEGQQQAEKAEADKYDTGGRGNEDFQLILAP